MTRQDRDEEVEVQIHKSKDCIARLRNRVVRDTVIAGVLQGRATRWL